MRAIQGKSVFLLLSIVCSTVLAQENAIESIHFGEQGLSMFAKIKLMSMITEAPRVNLSTDRARLVLDFPHTSNAIDGLRHNIYFKEMRHATVDQMGDMSRVSIELAYGPPPKIRLEGDTVFIVFNDTSDTLHQLKSAQHKIPFDIHAKNIDSTSLLVLAADLGHLNIVAGDEFIRTTLNVDDSSIDANQLIARIVSEQHLTMRNFNNITLIGSECRLTQNPNFPAQKGDQQLASLHFENALTSSLEHDVFSNDFSSIIDLGKAARLTIRTENKTEHDQLIAIATVEGWTVKLLDATGIQLIPNEILKKCNPQPASGNSSPPPIEVDIHAILSRPCPGLTWPGSSCSVIEKYTLGKR